MLKRPQPAAAAAADPKRPRADAAARDQPAAAANAAAVSAPCKQAPECEICNDLLKCPQCGDFDPSRRLDSAFKLPKNFGMIKLLETLADRDAMAEQRAAPPCQQCDPSQPRRAAIVHCNDCGVDYCKQHDDDAHAMELLSDHQRVSMADHAAQLSAAATAKKNAAFAAAAAASRLAAKEEEQKIEQTLKNAKERQEARRRDLESIKEKVEATVKALQDGADRLRSDFEQHRQMIGVVDQQLADSVASLAPLLRTAQQVQQAGDFDANLLLAQLRRDSQRLRSGVDQTMRNSGPGPNFEVDPVRVVKVSLSLSQVARQSLILSDQLTVKLAPLCKGLEPKAQAELLYRGSRDGFKRDDFVRCCANKGPTLTLVKVAGTHFVFGAYIHCSWPSVNRTVADPTGKSFLFSLVNASGKAVRFSLRDKERAIQLAEDISFGAMKYEGNKAKEYPNFILMLGGQAANQKGANTGNDTKDANTPYQPDDGQVRKEPFFAGKEDFAAEEIEVFQF